MDTAITLEIARLFLHPKNPNGSKSQGLDHLYKMLNLDRVLFMLDKGNKSKDLHDSKGALSLFIPFTVLGLLFLFALLCPGILGGTPFRVIFLFVALSSIYISARYSFRIHNLSDSENSYTNWFTYNQYVFNGLGSLMGWSALYIIIFYRINLADTHALMTWANKIGTPDFVLVLVAFLGISGYIPYVALLGKYK